MRRVKLVYRKGLRYISEPYRTLIEKLLQALLEVFGSKLISLVIYGSVAQGDYAKESDVDMLIIVEGLPRERFKRGELFAKAEEKLDKTLDKLLDEGYAISFTPIIKTPTEAMKITPLYLDMVEDAVIVYDKNSFFEKILEKLRAKLEELGAERVYIGKKWYWRLKKNYKFGETISL